MEIFKFQHFSRVYRVYRNTCGNLGETQNCVQTLALRARVPTQFLLPPKFPRVFLHLYRHAENVFYFLNSALI